MANRAGKTIDTTYLSMHYALGRGIFHRDYLAHCLRWSHVIKFIRQGQKFRTAHLLDVGCGTEVNLARAMYATQLTHTTGSYTGVDAGPIKGEVPNSLKFKATIHPKTDFVKWAPDRDRYDIAVSFEVLEHVEAYHSFKILQKICSLLSPNGTAFISTPCYDAHVGAAANHVNEMSYELVQWLLWAAGFAVEKVYGTFASQRDYKPHLAQAGLLPAFDRLGEYYDSEILACLLAPAFPQQARNCLWVVRLRDLGDDMPDLGALKSSFLKQGEHHSSSEAFQDNLKKILKELKL